MFAEPVTRPGVSPRILPTVSRTAVWENGKSVQKGTGGWLAYGWWWASKCGIQDRRLECGRSVLVCLPIAGALK